MKEKIWGNVIWAIVVVALWVILFSVDQGFEPRSVGGAIIFIAASRPIIEFSLKLPIHFPYVGLIPYEKEKRFERVFVLVFSLGGMAIGGGMILSFLR